MESEGVNEVRVNGVRVELGFAINEILIRL
jgi:hypothetical protein